MNPTSPTTPRRSVWRWVFLGLGLCLTPLLILAIVVASFFRLERNAAVLRQQVMAATDTDWHTKVQLSVGKMTIGAIRTGLAFVHNKKMADAKVALAAVRHASVGVYERAAGTARWSREQLFTDADRAMQKRGWTRLVGVADEKDTVLIYIAPDISPDKPVDLCLAVVSGRELVVVSTSVDASKLVELAESHSSEDLKARLHLARLRL